MIFSILVLGMLVSFLFYALRDAEIRIRRLEITVQTLAEQHEVMRRARR